MTSKLAECYDIQSKLDMNVDDDDGGDYDDDDNSNDKSMTR